MATTPQFGTLQVTDLLRYNNTSVIDFGEQDVYESIRLYLLAYNQLMREQLDLFVQETTEREVGTGGPGAMLPTQVDEYGVPDAQKIASAAGIGFPLRNWAQAMQWTPVWMLNHTVAELAAQVMAFRAGDNIAVEQALRLAIYKPTNTNFVDVRVDYKPIDVKAFANGDGFPIPPSPNGFVFDESTHTHYMGTAGGSLVAADVDSLIQNVVEHYNGGQLYLFVPQGVEATMQAGRVAGNFPLYSPLLYMDQVAPTNNGVYMQGALAASQPNNRVTGRYRDALVVVKPWIPPNTLVCFMTGTTKPIAKRIRGTIDANGAGTRMVNNMAGGGNGDLRMVFASDTRPLNGQLWEHEYGFGVRDRLAGAVMTIGSSTYTMPSIVAGSSAYFV